MITATIQPLPLVLPLRYHGVLSREDAADLLCNDEGCYLVREGHGGEPILSFT